MRNAFTLIELLVVVTIIVVLLALLTPAMEEAVYQAELATCAARMESAATGVLQYSAEYRRTYPLRQGPRDTTLNWSPALLANRLHDDRRTIFLAARPQLLLDPFASPLNYETTVPDNYIAAHNNLWFGFEYFNDRGAGMRRLGDRFAFNGSRYSLLISDSDHLTTNYEDSSHPDRADRLLKRPGYQDAVNPWPGWNAHGAFATWTNWSNQNNGLSPRGPLDLNYAYDDGSLIRMSYVTARQPDGQYGDERMERVPGLNTGTPGETITGGIQVPRQ